VTSDKDMMQLVGGNVRVLRPGAGPDKTDLVVDAAKVEELMGVPPAKVADVMALMGDSIDNIPGAKGIGEKGAKELIRRFGSAEAALERAKEVEGKRYREALENSREAVVMSKQLAVIDTAAPVKLVLDDLTRREQSGCRGPARALRGAGFHFAAARSSRVSRRRSRGAERFRRAGIPRRAQEISERDTPRAETAVWLTLAEGEREEEGFGSR
jgi:5'-3' exonuclease